MDRVSRSLSLLRKFVLISAAILAAGGFVLASVLGNAMRSQATEDAQRSLAQYVDGVLANQLVQGHELRERGYVGPTERRELSNREDILSIKVWRRDGVLAWTNRDEERIGQRFEIGHHLEEALGGQAAAELEDLSPEGEHRGEVAAGIHRALEIYAPLHSSDRRSVIGAYEVYADAAPLESNIATRQHQLWAVVAVVFLALWGALVLLVRSASRLLRRQTRDLRLRSAALSESYAALAQSSLEAIEMLNATVDAKDRYTAGHSHRVQRIAMAIAGELGLTDAELDSLRWGSLFHDIGKLAVPDAILLKPGRLTEHEYAVMKTHSAEGARIVGKLSKLRSTVPTIRHHHERPDGLGYPDGLAGGDIPPTAAIVGLADAWDAMTTDRPYRAALTPEDALGEIRDGRGTQFVPEVVDAFMAAFEREPDVFTQRAEPAKSPA